MGALIAYEMAKILKDEVDSIIMLNIYVPKMKNLKELFQVTKSLLKFKTKNTFKKLSNISVFSFAKKSLLRYSKTQLIHYNTLCYDCYKLRAIEHEVKMSLFCLEENNKLNQSAILQKYGWEDFIEKKITINYIQGEHLTVLLSENAQSLSKTINNYYESIK